MFRVCIMFHKSLSAVTVLNPFLSLENFKNLTIRNYFYISIKLYYEERGGYPSTLRAIPITYQSGGVLILIQPPLTLSTLPSTRPQNQE